MVYRVASTIYCIEGINLALPTVCRIEGASRQQSEGGGAKAKEGDEQQQPTTPMKQSKESSVIIVVGAVFSYGIITLIVSWIGLVGGLGGGEGTTHGEDGCWDVTYCLNSSAVRLVYMLSLGVALVLTLPLILFPSTQLLEVWLDDRTDERRRKVEEMDMQQEFLSQQQKSLKSLLSDDEDDTVFSSQCKKDIQDAGIEMRDFGCLTHASLPSCTMRAPPPLINFDDVDDDSLINTPRSAPPASTTLEKSSLKTTPAFTRKLKYWKLRMCIAVTISTVAILEGTFPSVLKGAGIIRGVSLSITGLIVPPLLYMSAMGGGFSVPMAVCMSLLIGLGLFNIVLVLMSAFGSKDFIVEEGRQNFDAP